MPNCELDEDDAILPSLPTLPSISNIHCNMRVLVSGAGIAGSTVAFFLGKAGATVTVVEKAPALLPHGQNVDIQGSAVTAIKKMGLFDEVMKHNTSEIGTKFIHQSGKSFAPLPLTEDSIASLTSECEILRGDLALILYRRANELSNVTFLFDTTIKEILSNDEESTRVELSNGEINEYDLVIAADGQWSKLRKQYFPQDSIKVVDKGMYVVYYTAPRKESDDNYWNIYWSLNRRLITLRPDPHGTTRAMFSIMPTNDAQKQAWQEATRADAKTKRELLRREFADAGWQSQRLLDAVDDAPDLYLQAMQQIKMSKWHNNRIICLGDTAYAPTPLTGAGTTLAITGAYLLAGELEKLKEGQHPRQAFEAYEQVCRPFIEHMQKIVSFVPGIAHPTTYWQRYLLQTGASILSTVLWVVRSVPLLSRKVQMTNEGNDDGFPLPSYKGLDEKLQL